MAAHADTLRVAPRSMSSSLESRLQKRFGKKVIELRPASIGTRVRP